VCDVFHGIALHCQTNVACNRGDDYLAALRVYFNLRSGIGASSISLSVESHSKWFSSMNFHALVAVATLLSEATPSELTTHRFPSRVHSPSPKPPLASNTHDRTCSKRGSQPITCVTDMTSRSLSLINCSRSKKLRLRVHLH